MFPKLLIAGHLLCLKIYEVRQSKRDQSFLLLRTESGQSFLLMLDKSSTLNIFKAWEERGSLYLFLSAFWDLLPATTSLNSSLIGLGRSPLGFSWLGGRAGYLSILRIPCCERTTHTRQLTWRLSVITGLKSCSLWECEITRRKIFMSVLRYLDWYWREVLTPLSVLLPHSGL